MNLIYSLPEFRCGCRYNCCSNSVNPEFKEKDNSFDKVFIKKDTTTRKKLQELGTEMGRNKYGDDIWIDIMNIGTICNSIII